MKTVRSFVAGFRPAFTIVRRRIAFPLLLLIAGLLLVQPCVGQSGTWIATGNLVEAREFHTATLLANGKVLVAAGEGSFSPLASAELYDPASGTWTVTGSLATARLLHTATLLTNGKVLVAGGQDSGDIPFASAELYDPATGIWTPTGNLAAARHRYTATLLPNGMVLVAGGFDGNLSALASAELYDPATATWTTTGSLNTGRGFHTATLLPNGVVLVAGGEDSIIGALASAELYDPASGTWTTTGSLANERSRHTATLLLNGKVLVAGREFGSPEQNASAELYDPTSGTWTVTGSLNTGRGFHTATLLPDAKVLVAGGQTGIPGVTLASAELYDPASGTWTVTGSLDTPRHIHTATLLPNGMVLGAAGGGSFGPLTSAELYIGPATARSQPLNISARANVGIGDNVLIAGIIVSGSDPAPVVFRALGRSLAAFGITGVLDNPTLELHDSTGAEIAINFDWKENSAEDQMVLTDNNLAPTDFFESAIVKTLDPGAYTAIVSGENDTTGVSVVEAYNLSTDTADSKFANISTRGNVGTGENVMIGGFILVGGSAEVIMRAIGPSLTSFGIAGALQDPTLELHDANGALIQSNDNWRSDQETEIIATTIPPSNDSESAIVLTLTSGAYTAIVRGKDDTTGVGLVEIYNLQ